ncbi:hypothetical protein [Streptomyces sp. HSG2]|uniref:hypothetical protein n=1 Tax=Streptomyces sp. HSG2 TaxID=2797167 RepID=UPI001908A147|nr:hypothetical protein [Streptomyces sp. HSG2]
MIEPSGISQFTGDLDQLERDVAGLRGDAIGIRGDGMDAHSRFQALEAFYTAPEADDLFATTRPVMDQADSFAAKLETVADALDTFSVEARPLTRRLAQLKSDAITFVDGVRGDDEWMYDEGKIQRHQELMDGVAAAESAFREAERRAAGKISAIVGGPEFVVDDGSHTSNGETVMYGYDADVLQQAEELPWGTPESESHHAWEVGYWAKSFFWDGLVIDNIVGSVKGLGTLVGWDGSDAAGDAWSHLGDIVSGIGQYTTTPYDAFMDRAIGPDEESATETRQKQAAKDFGKSLVAWDMWGENPARASATVVFNVLTLGAGPLAAASKGGRAGAGARTAATAARIGEYIDPVAAGLKVSGKAVGALPKISDVTANIRTGFAGAGDSQRLNSVLELDDGSKVIVEDGQFIPVDKRGNAIGGTPRREASASTRTAPEPTPEPTPARQRELAGVGASSRMPGVGAHAGENLPPQAGHETPTNHGSGAAPHSRGPAPGGTGAGHAADSGTSRSHVEPVGAGHGGTSSGGHVPEQRGGGSSPTGGGRSGATDPVDVMRQQVNRANTEPGYFEKYYKVNGNRLSTRVTDEGGFVPPQLVKDPETGKWIAASEAPPPVPPKFLGDPVLGTRAAASPDALTKLDDAAQRRHRAIAADQLAEGQLKDAQNALAAHDTPANQAAVDAADSAHKPLHKQMSESGEAYGEAIAEYHVVPEHYPNATIEKLDGPANGNDQFDQVWRREDGGYVVIEAKSSVSTQLGARNLPNGRRVSQGTREYFLDIIREMHKRGRKNPNEARLADELEEALDLDKLDYILVKGNVNAGQYAGYTLQKFDIG